ncbi:MAG: NosD domain-containing protein [Planctomycetota bacterium]|jgi:hypothetical protein
MRILIALLLLFAIPGMSLGENNWYVPDDFLTIQSAIGSYMVKDGDTVLVRPGTYVENIDFLGKAIRVQSEQGPEVTIIDGGNPSNPDFGTVVIFKGGESRTSVLEGFTIQNGTGSGAPGVLYFAGGIACVKSAPTIRNNIICNNQATGDGGGIFCYEASPLIEDNIISYNETELHGAGIACMESSAAEILNNTIHENRGGTMLGNGWGGGIGGKNSSVYIADNDIHNNYAHTGGGGVWFKNSSPVIVDNRIHDNESEWRGGGIYIGGHSESSCVKNNLIHDNTSLTGGGMHYTESYLADLACNTIVNNTAIHTGGGLHINTAGTEEITNSIIFGNTAAQAAELWVGGGTDLTVAYCCVGTGPGTHWAEPGSTLIQGAGMIDEPPQFVAPAEEDFHLLYTSPCRDAGTNSGNLDSEDFEGDPRIVYGTIDMGADEFAAHLYYLGEATPGGSVKAKLIGTPGSSPVGLFIGLTLFDTPVTTPWGDFFIEPPYEMVTTSPFPQSGVIALPETIPVYLPTPLDIFMQALVQDELTNLSVVEVR